MAREQVGSSPSIAYDAATKGYVDNLLTGVSASNITSTATSAGTTTLNNTSGSTQLFTGTTTQTVKLPTTSIAAGAQYTIINNSTGAVTVQSSGANTIVILAGGTSAMFTAVVATPTSAANWTYQYIGDVVASGKKLTVSNSLTLAGTDATTMTFPSSSGTVATLDATQTLTNKQVTKRVTAIASSATPTFNTDSTDLLDITALAVDISSMTTNMSGTPTNGQALMVRIKDNGTARAIAWGGNFKSSGVASLLTTTVISKTHHVFFVYNSNDLLWWCLAVDSTGA